MKRHLLGLLLLAASLLAIPSASAHQATCNGLTATIVGTSGPDVLVGTSGPDVIAGLGGADEIYGGSGDDTICGGPGPDSIEGGSGADALFGGAGADEIWADPDVWVNLGSAGDDFVRGGSSSDRIWGGAGDDDLNGGPGDDAIFGNYGDDELSGNKRNDLLVGGHGFDSAVGGSGDDECSAESVRCDAAIPELGNSWLDLRANTVEVNGSVTHIEPITAVDFAVLQAKSELWVQADGTLGPDRVWHVATLTSPGTTETTWTATITLPGADYSLSARAIDADGDIGRLRPRLLFRVLQPELRIGLPLTDFIYQYHGLEDLPSGTTLGSSPRDKWVTAVPESGTGDAVRLGGALLGLVGGVVDVSIRDRATGLWLQVDGTFAADAVHHSAACWTCLDSPNVNWLFDADLADGDYGLHVFGVFSDDGSIVVELEQEWRFTVDGSQASTPHVAVDQSPGTEFSGPVAFSGTASDDFGVARVEISVRDPATDLWLQNLTGPPVWDGRKQAFETTLSDHYGAQTDWAIEFTLPAGEYRLSAAVFDQVLHRSSIKPWLPFSVEP